MTTPIAIVFGAGKKVGASTVQMLRGKGYKVASVARTPSQPTDNNILALSYDLKSPTNVTEIFKKVRESWGEPSVVIYNAYGHHPTPGTDPFALSLQDFQGDLAANTTSAFLALKEAVTSFANLPKSTVPTFIFVGNCLNEAPLPGIGLLSLGVGKSASAHMIAAADQAYASKGWRFHYVDERTSDGKPMLKGVDGPAHAEFFGELIEGTAGAPAFATFTQGEGYKQFTRLS